MAQGSTDSGGEAVEPFTTDVVDTAGARWRLHVTRARQGGRLEATGLHLTSDEDAALTTTTLRRAERMVMEHLELDRAADAVLLLSEEEMLGEGDDDLVPPSRVGPKRNDAVWRRRAEAVALAYGQGRPMIDGLRTLEPGSSSATYQVRLSRTRAWDRETGAGILDGVGRAGRRRETDS